MPLILRPGDHSSSTIQTNWDGPIVDRVLQVEGLDTLGVPSDAVLWTALTDPLIPDTDAHTPHPSIPGVVAIDKGIRATSEKQALITVRYELPTPENAPALGGQTITVDASSVNIDQYFDIFNQRLTETYTDPGVIIITQYPKATIGRSLATWTFTTYEQTSEADIAREAVEYNESVNDAIYSGWPARTWRMDDISSRPYGKFRKWREVKRTMTYKADTWDFLIVVILNGRVPDDATDGNGFKRARVRNETDFSALPITMPTMPP